MEWFVKPGGKIFAAVQQDNAAVDLGKVPTWATISFPCELLAQEKITPVVEPVGPTTTQDKPALEQDTPTTQDKVKPAEKISDIEWWSDDPLRGFCSAIVQDPSNYELKVRQSWDPVLDLFIDNYYNSYLSGEDTKSILASAMETDKTTAFLLAKKLGSDISYYIQNNQNKPKIPPLDAGVVLLVSWKKSSVLWELRRYVQKMKQLGLWSDLVATVQWVEVAKKEQKYQERQQEYEARMSAVESEFDTIYTNFVVQREYIEEMEMSLEFLNTMVVRQKFAPTAISRAMIDVRFKQLFEKGSHLEERKNYHEYMMHHIQRYQDNVNELLELIERLDQTIGKYNELWKKIKEFQRLRENKKTILDGVRRNKEDGDPFEQLIALEKLLRGGNGSTWVVVDGSIVQLMSDYILLQENTDTYRKTYAYLEVKARDLLDTWTVFLATGEIAGNKSFKTHDEVVYEYTQLVVAYDLLVWLKEKLEGDIDNLMEDKAQWEEYAHGIEDIVSDLWTKLHTLNDELETKQQHIEDLNEQLKTLNLTQVDNNMKINSLQQDIIDQHRKQEELLAEREKLAQINQELFEETGRLRNKYKDLVDENGELVAWYEDKLKLKTEEEKEQTKKLLTEYGALKKKYQALEVSQTKAQSDIDKLRRENEQLHNQLKGSTAVVDGSKKDLLILKSTIKDLEEQIKTLEWESKIKQEEYDEIVALLNDEKAELEAQYKEAWDRIATLEGKIAAQGKKIPAKTSSGRKQSEFYSDTKTRKYASKSKDYNSHMSVLWSAQFIFPLENKNTRVSSWFGRRQDPIRPWIKTKSWKKIKNMCNHRWVDYTGKSGEKIRCIYDGVVVGAWEWYNGGYGNMIVVMHTIGGQKYYSSYHHLKSKSFKVKAGDIVKAWTRIGGMWTTGKSTGVHLHIELMSDSGHCFDLEKMLP